MTDDTMSAKSGDNDSARDVEASTEEDLTPQLSQQEQEVLERVRSERYIAKETMGADDSDNLGLTLSGKPLPPFGGGRPYPPMPPARDQYVVEYSGPDDPDHPLNWSSRKKLKIMAILGFSTMGVAWGSSIFASATLQVAEKFHVGLVVAILGMSLYVFGFASGPLFWAPISEMYGRRLPLLIGVFGFAVFNLSVARAYDLQTIMICRFFGGFFGASCLAVVPATFNDIFTNEWRGTALVCFSAAVFCGPLIAPIIGGFIVNSYLGWRWSEYITMIWGFFAFSLIVFFVEETYAPVVLVRKAAKLRRATGNWGIHARLEQTELDYKGLIERNFSRPVKMLFTEPIMFLVTIYSAFIYGILYLLLEAYPIIFVQGYGMSPSVGELPYFGMIIGELIGCGIVLMFEPITMRAIKANNNKPVPEMRLLPTIIGGVLFPIGMFWLTWTGAYHQHVHWIVPTISGLFIGSGIVLIFLTLLTYLIESYMMFAASAMAANTFLRSAFGAGFPLFAEALFHNLGVQWAGTLLGCVGILLTPVPVLFFIYGKRLRKLSKYAPDM
ncbi:major facilitator superfamily domain-containing protein [Lipomyces kononenkoae]|uniref:Major facilitator superfamily domain-containing protein n=1 Tax=Lipomyces kononenkoae TaxID=34357 RepID=A0ACC3T1P8_LIPKO